MPGAGAALAVGKAVLNRFRTFHRPGAMTALSSRGRGRRGRRSFRRRLMRRRRRRNMIFKKKVAFTGECKYFSRLDTSE